MRLLFLTIFLLILSTSCATTETQIFSEKKPCDLQHGYLFAEEVDQMLLESCFAEMFNQCHPNNRECQYYGQLLCLKESLELKLGELDEYIGDECYKEIDGGGRGVSG